MLAGVGASPPNKHHPKYTSRPTKQNGHFNPPKAGIQAMGTAAVWGLCTIWLPWIQVVQENPQL